METAVATPKKEVVQDFLPLLGTDYLEFYVGNAKQAAFFYKAAFGFQSFAYSGLETGQRDRVSYVVKQNKITLVFTTPLNSKDTINEHLRKHGDGVKSYAMTVDDATSAFEETTKRGADVYMEPTTFEDKDGKVVISGIKAYGDTVNIFVERKGYKGIFLPGFQKWNSSFNPPTVGLKHVDHAVGNVELGKMNYWVEHYEKVMGFHNLITFDDEDISTEYSALMSKVVSNGNGWIKFPINEPAEGKRKSQIEEYLDFYEGPGVQHLALATDDILSTVAELKKRGVEFLTVPDSYYVDLLDRVGHIDEEISAIRELNLLIDRDPDGYMLQIFTKPLEDRPTLFLKLFKEKELHPLEKGILKPFLKPLKGNRNSGETFEK